MILKINKKQIKVSWSVVFYIITILAYFLYLTRDLNYNTAFVDEAIYATVGEEVSRGIYWENALSWMGGSYVYPLISAWFNRRWGLVGIRFYSTICLIVAGIIAGELGKQIGGKKVRLLSTAIFLSSAIVLNLGQLGTYDTPALAFLAISIYTALASRYEKTRRKYLWGFVSGILFALAVLTKYVVILFLPIMALLTFYRNKKLNFKPALVWFSVAYIIIFYFAWNNIEDLVNFFTGDHFSEPTPRLTIAKQIFTFLNIQVIGAIGAFIFAIKKIKGDKKFLLSFLFLSGLVTISYHLGSSNFRSAWKHMVFTSLFWAPMTAWGIVKLINSFKNIFQKKMALANAAQLSWSFFTFLAISSIWFNFSKHWEFQRSWPSATSSLEYLEVHRQPEDKIFAEASAIYKYHLFSGFEDPEAWASTWYLGYEGKEGTDAMKAAIWDKHFDYIVLNGYFTDEINKEIRWDIEQNYKPVLKDMYSVQGGYEYETIIWTPRSERDMGGMLEEEN